MAPHIRFNDTIEGERIVLKLPMVDDLPWIAGLWADTATMEAVGGPLEWPLERWARWYQGMVEPGRSSDFYCLIVSRKEQMPVGEVSFHGFDGKTATLNIKVVASHRGRGFGQDALQAFLRFFFEQVGGADLIDDVAPGNTAGQRLLLRCGFLHDPTRQDVYLLRMTRQRYGELYG
jgi:RimJ/RimL family protein N-acetyltransferase